MDSGHIHCSRRTEFTLCVDLFGPPLVGHIARRTFELFWMLRSTYIYTTGPLATIAQRK